MRALKYAVGLAGEVELGFAYRGRTLSELYGAGDELFEAWYPLGEDPAATLPEIVEAFAPDVIHSHNLPDALTVLALDTRRRAGHPRRPRHAEPAAHALRGRLSRSRATRWRSSGGRPRSRAALITISPELVAELAARYRLPRRVLAYANYALLRDLPARLPAPRPLDGPPRLVYQGTLSTNGGHYDLRDLFAAIAAQGLSLDVYPAREVPEYREIPGIRVHHTLPLADLLQRARGLRLRLGGLQRRASTAPTSTPRCRTSSTSTSAAACR